jgi:hypothetical protein
MRSNAGQKKEAPWTLPVRVDEAQVRHKTMRAQRLMRDPSKWRVGDAAVQRFRLTLGLPELGSQMMESEETSPHWLNTSLQMRKIQKGGDEKEHQSQPAAAAASSRQKVH